MTAVIKFIQAAGSKQRMLPDQAAAVAGAAGESSHSESSPCCHDTVSDIGSMSSSVSDMITDRVIPGRLHWAQPPSQPWQ
jgi:hypothetical protein